MRLTISTAFFATTCLLTLSVYGQNEQAEKYVKHIDEQGYKTHLKTIASDDFMGRETGREGQKKAEQYLVDQIKEIGLSSLKDSYTQNFDVIVNSPNASLTINQQKSEFLDAFYFYEPYSKDIKASDIVFCGYGIDDKNYNDYANSVEGKVVLIFEDEPYDKKGKSLISGTKEASEWSNNWKLKYKTAKNKGAIALLTITKGFKEKKEIVGDFLSSNPMVLADGFEGNEEVPNIYISEKLAQSIVGGKTALEDLKKTIKYKGAQKPQQIEVNLKLDFELEKLVSSNVLGYISGSEKPDEFVVISAHYDHLGVRGEKVFNGADDDGTGTTALLELAEAFMAAKKEGNGPKRSILFLWVSGEEKGLLGSDYFTRYPLVPLGNIVANLNVDMIGRHDKDHEGSSDYVYLIGSDRLSKDLHVLSEKANDDYTQLMLDYTYNDENDPNQFYYRSDHYNFAKNGIPVIFYFSGVHEDYHKETDTWEKIEYPKTIKIVKLVYYTAWEIANREERLKVDKEKLFDR